MVTRQRKTKGKKYSKRVSKKTGRKKSANRRRTSKRGGFPFFRRKKPTTMEFRTRRAPDVVDKANAAVCTAAKQKGIFRPEPEILPMTIPRRCDPAEFFYMQQEDPTLKPPLKEECETPGHVLMTDPTDKGGKGYDGWMHRNNPDAICGSGYYKENELNELVERSAGTVGGKRKKTRKSRKKHLRKK